MGKPKILIVDDAATVRKFQSFILSKEGFEVLDAENGREGLEVALAEKPDLILLDILMPEMDGITCLRNLRQFDETRETPVIMVTTRSEVSKVDAAREAGCNDYIFKPVNPSDLKKKIRELLTRK